MSNILAQADVNTATNGGLAAFMLVFWVLGLVNFVLFVISLIHLIQHPDVKDRMLWIIVVLLVPLGGVVYFFGPRKKYNQLHAGGAAAAGTPEAQAPYTPPVSPVSTEPAPEAPIASAPAPESPTPTDQPAESPQPTEPTTPPNPTDPTDPTNPTQSTPTPPTNPVQ